MQQRLPSLLELPVAFAHRGARAHAPDNTMEAFQLAHRLGATGLESDVWQTADGVLVLDHDGVVRRGLRRRSFSEVLRADLPPHVPELSELLSWCSQTPGSPRHLSLDLKTHEVGRDVIELVQGDFPNLIHTIWLCHPDVEVLADLRRCSDDIRLVNSTRLQRIGEGPERRAALLAQRGIDGINLHHSDMTGGLTTLFHRFGRTAFAWDLQFDDALRTVLRMGVDGVYSDWVDRMMDAYRAEVGAPPTTGSPPTG